MELLAIWFLAAVEILAIYILYKIAKKSYSKIKASKGRPGPIALILMWSGVLIPVLLFTVYIYFFYLRYL